MHHTLGNVTVWLLIAVTTGSSLALGSITAAVETFTRHGYDIVFADPPSSSASAWIAFDVATGDVLAEHNADEPLPIASVTKLPAAATLYHAHDLFATTTISWSDVLTEGRAGKLAAGDVYTIHTLLFPLLLESSNDAAVAVGRAVATLTEDMNAYVRSLGLTHTSFADTSGLSDQNISTAAELAVITQDVFRDSKHVLDITGMSQYLAPEHGWLNNNPFIDEPAYIGGKHGYTHAAKYTATLVFNETLGDVTRPVGYIVLGSDDLERDVAALRRYVTEHVTFR